MVSAWKISCIISSLVVVQAKDNIHSHDIPYNKSIDQADCDQNSKYLRQVGVKNVCVTKDYSIFDELDENDKPRIQLVFLDKKVAKVDDKKKEITLELVVLMLWRDERIKASFKPGKSDIELPPRTTEYQSVIWSPLPKMVIPNIRSRKYLQDPIMALLGITKVESVNGMKYENISFTGDDPIINSLTSWSVTISCSLKFWQFPFDKNTCIFYMTFFNMDVTLGISNESIGALTKQSDTDGFRIEIEQMDPPDVSETFNAMYQTDVKLSITVERQSSKYIYQYYIPCITIVAAASFSFIIPLSAIPGRVALIVTQFLTLTNIFINQMVSLDT